MQKANILKLSLMHLLRLTSKIKTLLKFH